jgi:hypothetical protein
MECGANGTITLGGAFTFDTASDTSGSGSYQIVGTVAVDGAWNVKGSAEVLGGTLTLNSDAQCGTLSIFDKGTLAGAGNVTVTELLDWRDARIQGSGTLISLANATIGFGGAEVILESRTLCLNGSTRWTEGKIRLQGGAVIQNKGVFTIPATADSMLAGPGGGTFSNSGSVTRNNSGALWPGATTIAPKLENSGIVEVDAGVLTFTGGGGGNGKYRVLKGATLEFSGLPYNLSGASYEGDGNVLFKINTAIGPGFLPTGGLQVGSGNVSLGLNPGDTYTFPGALQVDQGAQFSVNGGNLLNQGCLSGSGTFCLNDAHLCDQGATAPGNSPGILTILGPYVQGPGGRLQIEIAGTAAGTQYDQLKVTGPVTLSGQLQVALLNNYVPKAGDKFSILTATSLSGVFAHTTAPRFANNLTLVPYYGAGGVTLVFTNAPVVPVSLSPSLSGSELGLAWSGEYVLETTRDLKPPVQWQPVTNVVGQGTQRQFKADTQTAPSAYYRLRQD